MRTFKFADDESYKFWKISLEGTSYTVNYGRIGGKGQSSTKSFPSEAKAKAAYEKIIAEKLSKGYIETTPVESAPSLSNTLERALFDAPDDIANHAAYADWLSQQGDARGEFIQVQLQLEDESLAGAARKKLQEREAELLKEHERTWLGALAEHLVDQKIDAELRRLGYVNQHRFARGWLDSLKINSLTVAFARALVNSPLVGLLRDLRIESCAYEADGEFEAGPDAVGEYPAVSVLLRLPKMPNLRVFQIGEEDRGSINGEGTLDLVERMPNLGELRVLAPIDMKRLFQFSLPKLRILQVYHSHRSHLDLLANNSSFAQLEQIYVHPHAIEYDDEEAGAYIGFKEVKAICRSPHLKKLTHLQLRLNDMGDKGVKEIIDSGLLKRLEMLDLHGGIVTDEGARMLAECPDIKHLKRLDVSMNRITKAGVALLEKTGVELKAGEQYDPNAEDNEYLFMGDME